MTTHDSGPDLRESHSGEVRPAADETTTIIHASTDMCQQAVLRLLVERYDGIDLENYECTLVELAGQIDHALAKFDAFEARTIDIGKLVEALADAPPPAPLDCLGPDDIDWQVQVEVSPDRVIRTVLESLPKIEGTRFRTFLGGADDLARARLDGSIQAVAEGVVSRQVTSLWLPSRAAAERGIDVVDLGARLAAEALPLAMAAAVGAVEHAPSSDWTSQLAATVENTAVAVETGNLAMGASLANDMLVLSTVAAFLYCAILEAGIDYANIVEEQFTEQVEGERRWDPDQVAAEAAQAVVEVLRSRGVRVTESMELAGMTNGKIMHLVALAREELELERAKPELARGYRRDAAKGAKKARKATRKAQREARRRGRAS